MLGRYALPVVVLFVLLRYSTYGVIAREIFDDKSFPRGRSTFHCTGGSQVRLLVYSLLVSGVPKGVSWMATTSCDPTTALKLSWKDPKS